MRLQSGTVLGPYSIIEPIGAGGMGEVYRARDSRLGRDVAVKVLNAAPDAERLARFEREARATALLAHHNILTIFDIGTHDGAPFLVCELLEGQTLRERLVTGPLDAPAAVALALQLARGVAAAHALRVVHRDIKPENLFITRDGTLKILDFGLAKLRSDAVVDPSSPTVDASSPGLVIGTPAYMAPEQVRGAPADERTDIFAIGAVLYEMLGGHAPFVRPSAGETLAAILHEPVAPLPARVPSPVVQVVLRCLEKAPADRYQSAAELAVALDATRSDSVRTPAASAAPGGASDRAVSSIAVLPFLDMSPAHDHDYLCDGVADELISALTHIDGLRVAARSTSFQFRSSDADARAIGARLGVDAVLEGGVRRVGDRLRVTVQLVDVADGYQRWSQRFDGSMDDVFDIQDKIAESVATALRGILSRREKDAMRRPGTEAEVYEYFLRGRQHLHDLSRSTAGAARELFERAIDLDPAYAPAHAALAQIHAWSFEWWGGGEEAYRQADEATRKALELAPQLSEAHTARAFVLSLHQRYDEAAHEYEEAIRLNPNSFDALYLYGRMAFAAGNMAQSAELFARGAEVQPDDFQCPILGGQALIVLGRHEEGLNAVREGIRRAERRLEIDPRDSRALSLGASALAEIGEVDRGVEWSVRAVEISPDDPAVLINSACLYAKQGRKEEALDYLEKSFGRGFGKRDWIENDPDYDLLRDDPRFQALLDKLK